MRSHGVRTRMERDTIFYGERVAKALRAENKYHYGNRWSGPKAAINTIRHRALQAGYPKACGCKWKGAA